MENEKLVETVARHDEIIKQNCKDIDELKDQSALMYKIATSVELLAQQTKTTNEKIEKLDEKVDDKFEKMDETIEDIKTQSDKKDAKKWDKLMWLIFGAIITIIAGIIKTALGI